MPNKPAPPSRVVANEDLRARLNEAEETLRAIRSGEVDALVVQGPDGDQIFTLKGTDHTYRLLIEAMQEGALTMTEAGLILYCNRSLAQIIKTPLERVIGTTIAHWIAPESQLQFKALMLKTELEQSRHELFLMAGDATRVPVYLSIKRQSLPEMPDYLFLVVTDLTDINERKKAEEKLNLEASFFTHAREGILITDPAGNILDVNESFTRISGYSRDEVLGQNPRLLHANRHDPLFFVAMWRDLVEKGHWYGEVWNQRKNGEVYAEMLNISALRDAQGNIRQYMGLISDITALKAHEKELEHIAHYDALTHLPNRVLLADRLQQAMVQAQRREKRLAVAYLDLDKFKTVNDTHGHEVGDKLLIAVAARMKQALREGDTFSRLGGDEFVAVLLDVENIKACEATLNRLLAAAADQVQIGDLFLDVSASLGITFFPQAEDVSADQLLRQADQAMYQAKQAGKNRYHVFDAEQDRSVRGHHESIERIRRALSANEFVLYYQPKVNMRSGEIIGAEALIRWQHPDKGLLLPSDFLPVIEDHPLSIELGEWVIDHALTQLGLWHGAGLAIPVSVNVGARQLQQVDFVERLRVLLAGHAEVQPSCLEIEVLETSALEDLIRVSLVIDECRTMGVLFALDDFGTGYSSLTYLKRLPVSHLKIDQSFVRNMLADLDDLSILEGVISLASAFQRTVIAEGVETVAHGTLLLQLGCELAQGFCIARPMPAHEMPAWAATWRPNVAWVDLAKVGHADLPLLFAGVEHHALVRALCEHLLEERVAPAPLDQHGCHFGQWLALEGRARLGAQAAFKAAETLHRNLHELASELYALHAQGQKAQARQRVEALQGLLAAMLEPLKALEIESRK